MLPASGWSPSFRGAVNIAWPVAHIGNIAVAVVVNIAFVVVLGSLVWTGFSSRQAEAE